MRFSYTYLHKLMDICSGPVFEYYLTESMFLHKMQRLQERRERTYKALHSNEKLTRRYYKRKIRRHK